MKLKNPGKNTSRAQVIDVSIHGLWLLVHDSEYFLSFKDFPWFQRATIAQIHNIRLLNGRYLHWPDIDVDLELDSLTNLEKYPLIYK